jgi:hypothetical protein
VVVVIGWRVDVVVDAGAGRTLGPPGAGRGAVAPVVVEVAGRGTVVEVFGTPLGSSEDTPGAGVEVVGVVGSVAVEGPSPVGDPLRSPAPTAIGSGCGRKATTPATIRPAAMSAAAKRPRRRREADGSR